MAYVLSMSCLESRFALSKGSQGGEAVSEDVLGEGPRSVTPSVAALQPRRTYSRLRGTVW